MKHLIELTNCFIENAPANSIVASNTCVMTSGGETIFSIRGSTAYRRVGKLCIIFYSQERLRRNKIPVRLWELMTHKIISAYHAQMGMPEPQPIKHCGDYFTQGGQILPVRMGYLSDYPILTGQKPHQSNELRKITKNLTLVPKQDSDIYELKRSAGDPNMLQFLTVEKAREGMVKNVLPHNTTFEKYSMPGKPVKVLKKAYYMTADTQERFISDFRIPEIRLTIEPKERIVEIYTTDNYVKAHTLGKSCMRPTSTHSCDRDEVFDLLIHRAKGIVVAWDGDMVMGRALLWNVTIEGKRETLLDRVYTGNYIYESSFRELAVKNGWYSKAENDYNSGTKLISPARKRVEKDIELRLKKREYTHYPFLDTFLFMNMSGTKMSNNLEQAQAWGEKYYYKMQKTKGQREQLSNPLYKRTDLVWSDWHEEDIPFSDAVQTYTGDYILSRYAVRVGEEYAHEESEDIVWSDPEQRYLFYDDATGIHGEYYSEENVAYDDETDEYILRDDAVTIDNITTHYQNTVEDFITGNYILTTDSVQTTAGWTLRANCEEIDGVWRVRQEPVPDIEGIF